MSQTEKTSTEEIRESLPVETSSAPDEWQREVRCPITGRRVVAHRPGERMITSEEIYRMIREEEEREDLEHLL